MKCRICKAPLSELAVRFRLHQCPPLWKVWRDGEEDSSYEVHAQSAEEAAEQVCTSEYTEWDCPEDPMLWVCGEEGDDPAIKVVVSVQCEFIFWASEVPA